MKKLIAGIALCVSLSGLTPIAAGKAGGATIDIVAIGASNTEGIHVKPSQSYPAQLEAMLRKKGYNVRVSNAGVAGDTTNDLLGRLNSTVPRGTEIVILAPPVGNDVVQAVRRGQRPDRQQIAANIESAVRRLQARKIAVAYLSLGGDDSAIAQKYGLPFCQFPRAPQMYAANAGPHYTPEGYRRMAERVLPCVERLLPK